MSENFSKLLLWLLTTFIVADVVRLESSCPEYTQFYCACSLSDIAEVKHLRMCLYINLGKNACHPCPEHLQEAVNCSSCDDDICPICSPLNFGAGKSTSSHFKQPDFFRFTRHAAVLHARPVSLKDYHGYHGLESEEYPTLDELNSSNNQTVLSSDTFSRLLDTFKVHSLNELQKNINVSINRKIFDPKKRRQKWFFAEFPMQENSEINVKKIPKSDLMDDKDFKAKSFSVLEERNNVNPFELPLEKNYKLKLLLSEKRNAQASLNDSDYLESDIGKLKLNRKRKHNGKSKKINVLHNLPSGKINHSSFERFLNNEKENKVKNLENDKFILLFRPLEISDNTDDIHQNIPGKFKTHRIDKHYFKSILHDSGMDNIQCLITNESSKIYLNGYAVKEFEDDIQKCISDQSNVQETFLNVQEKFEPFETSCNVSLSQMLIFKCIGFEVGDDLGLRNMKFKETVKVYGSNFTDRIELMVEMTNLSLEYLSDSVKPTDYDKTTYSSLNGVLNIEVRLSLKKSLEKDISYSPDDVFRQNNLPKEDDIKIEPYFMDDKFKSNHWLDNWRKNANLKEVIHGTKPNIFDSGAKKKDLFINMIDQEYLKSEFLHVLDSLFLDNKDKSNKLYEYHTMFNDATKNTDRQESWEEVVYNKPKSIDKEIESENLFENSQDEIEQQFDKLKQPFSLMLDLVDTEKVTNSSNSGSNLSLKRVFRDIPHFLSLRSLKDTKNSMKIVMTDQSIMQLFFLDQEPIASQNLSSALSFRYRKNALIPNINETLHRKKLKNSDIFKLLNVSISNLKKSKMYKPDCETCSVIYKIMLDSGFKNDPRLMGDGRSSDVILMSKPQFLSYPHKPKTRTGNQQKSKTSSKDAVSFIIQINVNFLLLSSGDYNKLTSKYTRNNTKSKTNPLRNSPWADMRKNFIFKIPESFSSQSTMLKLSRSLKQNNLKPVFKELLNQSEFTEELQKILFALLSQMHEKNAKVSIGNFGSQVHGKRTKANIGKFVSASMILPTIKAEMTKFNETENYLDAQAEESNSSLVNEDSQKSHPDSTNKFAPNTTFKQLKNGTAQTNIKKIENIKESNQKEEIELKIALMQKTERLEQPENVIGDDRRYQKENKVNNIEIAKQQTSSMKNKDLEASGLGKIFSSENASTGNPLKSKSNMHYNSEMLKHVIEKMDANIGQKQTISKQIGKGLREARDNNKNSLNGFRGVIRLKKTGNPFNVGLAKNEDLHHREKRQLDSLVAIPHNNWCPVRSMRRNGHLTCSMWTFKKKCTLSCHSGYSYDGKPNAEMSCSRRQNKWTVDINKACTASGRDSETPERQEKPDKGSVSRPASEKPSLAEGKLPKVPPKAPAVSSANADENDDYYEEYDYQK